MQYTIEFLRFVFFCKSDKRNSKIWKNFCEADIWSEYGISNDDFWNLHRAKAIEDIYRFLNSLSSEENKKLIAQFIEHCQSQIVTWNENESYYQNFK